VSPARRKDDDLCHRGPGTDVSLGPDLTTRRLDHQGWYADFLKRAVKLRPGADLR